MTRNLGTGPYLESLSIYTFDLDTHVLKIRDYDFVLPAQDVAIPSNNYSIKRIGTHIPKTFRGWVYRPKFFETADKQRAVKDAALEKNATLILAENNQVQLQVTSGDGILFSSQKPTVLVLEYDMQLDGNGSDLIFAGAIQPSDYDEFNNKFGNFIKRDCISKEIMILTYSQFEYKIRYFNASHSVAFTNGAVASVGELNQGTPPGRFVHEWRFYVNPVDARRASYFAVAAEKKDVPSRNPLPH